MIENLILSRSSVPTSYFCSCRTHETRKLHETPLLRYRSRLSEHSNIIITPKVGPSVIRPKGKLIWLLFWRLPEAIPDRMCRARAMSFIFSLLIRDSGECTGISMTFPFHYWRHLSKLTRKGPVQPPLCQVSNHLRFAVIRSPGRAMSGPKQRNYINFFWNTNNQVMKQIL